MKLQTLVVLIAGMPQLDARSILRPEYKHIPSIETSWQDEHETGPYYTLKSWHLSERPIFNLYDTECFERNQLPKDDIPFRINSEHSISGKILAEKIENLITEIKSDQPLFTDFIVLKSEDFNWNEPAGLIVCRFKEYPFVVKIFLETPRSFVKPFSKGWKPGFFFVLGKGITRYLSGLTRIPNLENIRTKINQSSYWKSVTDLPRKWFYQPQCTRWFTVTGNNITADEEGRLKIVQTNLPSVYVIVADLIDGKSLKITKRANRKFGIKLSQYLGNDLDAHIENFMIEKETGKVVIIDTEHFITVTGISKDMRYNRYTKWYLKIAGKATHDLFFQNKQIRRKYNLFNNTTLKMKESL